MERVAILGAGELGGTIAHALARRDVVRTIALIDESGRVAAGKALDITQAAPVEGFATQVSGATDLSHVAGAAVIVVADRVAGGEWQGEDGLALLNRVAWLAGAAVVVCAGAAARELVDRGVRELKRPRMRLFGTAPEALAGGVRALVALALNGSPRDVSLTILGSPPGQVVIPWDDATVAGLGLTRLVDEPTRRRLSARTPALWPPGPHALAAAAIKTIEAMAGRHRQLVSAFVAPETPGSARTVALPIRVGASGIAEVVTPTLATVDRIALESATTI